MVSFVIPAHNEARLIGRTIGALHAAARACGVPSEIVVADDGSTDNTADVAAQSDARVVRIRARQIAVARNAGARAARGDLLVFVDADTIVPAATLAAVVDAVGRGAIGGGASARFDGRVPFYGWLGMWTWLILQRIGRLASGCFLFATREAFEAVGGFDETLFVAEDVDLSRRLHRAGRFVIIREPVVTSGRMVRAYSAFEAVGLLAGLLRAGPRVCKERAGHWYLERREDPGAIDAVPRK